MEAKKAKGDLIGDEDIERMNVIIERDRTKLEELNKQFLESVGV